MKRLIGVALAALLAVTGCAGQPTNNDTRSAPSASSIALSPPSDVESGPVDIKPTTAGTFKYLKLDDRGSYGCQDGMTLVVLNLTEDVKSDTSGKHTVTTHNGVTFELNLSDGYYWLSYPVMDMQFRSLVVNHKLGFEMPTFAWHNNPVSNSVDAALELRDVPNGRVSSLEICLVETAPTP